MTLITRAIGNVEDTPTMQTYLSHNDRGGNAIIQEEWS
jgi:hypothetical protein